MSPSVQQTNTQQSTLYMRVVQQIQRARNKAIVRQFRWSADQICRPNPSLLEDQMVESVPQVKFEKEDGFLAIMDTDPQVKFETKLFFHIHYKT